MIAILYRTPREEARLLATFGDEYAAYIRQTGRFALRLKRGSPAE
jgi:protein-S-isoprenylcysteine O-methyltransferase Ste14